LDIPEIAEQTADAIHSRLSPEIQAIASLKNPMATKFSWILWNHEHFSKAS
jgi:hypothetical protein